MPNEQICDGVGVTPAACTQSAPHSGIMVRALRLVVTALSTIGIGAEVLVAEAHSDATAVPAAA